MSEISSLWWTDERIEATLSRQYVLSHLKPEYQTRLFSGLSWGEGLTSETYLDWILTKAGKLFLILDELGIAERIFHLVDESVDDSELPVPEPNVAELRLSDHPNPTLDHKFFHAQWRFLVRGIGEGQHVKYSGNEGVPVEVARSGIVQHAPRNGVDRVVLSGAVCRVYLRTQIKINGAPHFFEEDEVLEEIRSLRQLAHEHIFSIYGSYFVDDSINVLFTGIYERTLSSYLTDAPQHFRRLAKPERRGILVNWPHCLVNGLAWLHANGQAHGAIRPSNILVDSDDRIFLGQFEVLDTIIEPPKINDVEAYQYAAPERWIRTAAVQDIAAARTMHHSGGRTARRPATSSSSSSSSNNKGGFPIRASFVSGSSRSDSAASLGTVIRLGSSNPSPTSINAASSASSSSSGHSGRRNALPFRKRPIIYTPSISSSNSSGSTTRAATTGQLASALSQTAIVRTWQSQQANTKLSDVFSLGGVLIDIFTTLCERKLSSFTSHRGAKNRTPGRGGGVADASFHLERNMGQVASWITLLEQDSKKRKGLAFRAVKPMLEVVRAMMAKDPAKRPSAAHVEREFAHIMRQLEGIIQPHCEVSKPINPTKLTTRPPKASVRSQQQQRQKKRIPTTIASEDEDVDIDGENEDPITPPIYPSLSTSTSGSNSRIDLHRKGHGGAFDKLEFGFAPRRWETTSSSASVDEREHQPDPERRHADDYDPDLLHLRNTLKKHWEDSAYFDDISVSLPVYEE
jgi:serine/threonine protein kinase